MFDPAEVTFDEIAVLILMLVIRSGGVALGARRDDRFGAALGNGLAQVIRIKGFISDNGLSVNALKQRGRLGNVMRLPLSESESGKVSQAFDQGMNLGGQSAARAPDRLRAFF